MSIEQSDLKPEQTKLIDHLDEVLSICAAMDLLTPTQAMKIVHELDSGTLVLSISMDYKPKGEIKPNFKGGAKVN